MNLSAAMMGALLALLFIVWLKPEGLRGFLLCWLLSIVAGSIVFAALYFMGATS